MRNPGLRALWAAFIALLAILSMVSFEARAADLLPVHSTIELHTKDVVAAKGGRLVDGNIDIAYRVEDVVHLFVDDANCLAYAENPKAYPDIDRGIRLAFWGYDPVLRFPAGVHKNVIGALLQGHSKRFSHVLPDGTKFAFTTAGNRDEFARDPAKFIPFIGGYCPGAMARNDVTPGDPRYAYFIPEAGWSGTWGIFGSARGPIEWGKMTPDARGAHAQAALAYWLQKTGQLPTGDKIALIPPF